MLGSGQSLDNPWEEGKVEQTPKIFSRLHFIHLALARNAANSVIIQQRYPRTQFDAVVVEGDEVGGEGNFVRRRQPRESTQSGTQLQAAEVPIHLLRLKVYRGESIQIQNRALERL